MIYISQTDTPETLAARTHRDGWRTWLVTAVAVTLALLLLPLLSSRHRAAEPAASTESGPVVSAPLHSPGTALYLPLVAHERVPAPNQFGVHITYGAGVRYADIAREVNATWVRYGRIRWPAVEPLPGQRNWGDLATIEADIIALNRAGRVASVIVLGTPEWAQQRPGYSCGPIQPAALPAFAAFMQELVARYSRPPYYVKYWELGNEPDIDPSLVGPDSGFGCWGDRLDPYYGGGSYAEMLKQVYPAIKRADPQARVLIGGLLLDCDPTYPQGAAGEPLPCPQGHFLEGILRNGGAPYFDIVAYHAYTYWHPGQTDWDRQHRVWQHRGGVIQGKAALLREVMARYGVHKPLLLNEASLLCYPTNPHCPSAEFYDSQANYAVRMFARSFATDLVGAVWYTLNAPGWREGSMVHRTQEVKPVFHTISWLTSQLMDVRSVQTLSNGTLEGYELTTAQGRVRILWTNGPEHVTYPLPADAYLVTDKFGTQIKPYHNGISVGFEPRFILMHN